jgi:1-phosphatidylinositol phosphodiesterase
MLCSTHGKVIIVSTRLQTDGSLTRMHLTISNQTQDDLRCTLRGVSQEDHVLIIQAHSKLISFSQKCSLLEVSRHTWNNATKEHEAISTEPVSVTMHLDFGAAARWKLVNAPADSEWVVYRNKVR